MRKLILTIFMGLVMFLVLLQHLQFSSGTKNRCAGNTGRAWALPGPIYETANLSPGKK